jgi:hypothetical protein
VRWNAGVNNYMTYITGDIPIGKYNSKDWQTWASVTARSVAAPAMSISI